MFSELLQHIPTYFINFILVTFFALVIGLEQRRHHIKKEFDTLFGTDRTFTLMGVLGYILYLLDPKNLLLFMGGGLVMAVFLGIYYAMRIKIQHKFGMTSLLTAFIVYCMAPLVCTQPLWLVLLIVVCVLVLTEIKEELFAFSLKFDDSEFISLAKFLLLTGVVLPLLPNEQFSPEINISPYRFWLAIVVVSGISYASYLLQKFVFPKAGILLTGILGGLYSSTATTVILARKSRDQADNSKIPSAMMLATGMMYLRILLLAFLFNWNIAVLLLPGFLVLLVVSGGAVFLLLKLQTRHAGTEASTEIKSVSPNPLEFKTAIVFAVLYVFFTLLTGFVLKTYGGSGINLMASIVGVTDIDPFLLSLFQGTWSLDTHSLVSAILIAVNSNNLLKLVYALVLSARPIRNNIVIGFGVIILIGTAQIVWRLVM
jgi:uncharacterized membrane protein (DUF4010 family)